MNFCFKILFVFWMALFFLINMLQGQIQKENTLLREDFLLNPKFRTQLIYDSNDEKLNYIIIPVHEKFEHKTTVVTGNLLKVNNPIEHFAYAIPKYKCSNRQPVIKTAEYRQCKIAVNGGFFDMRTGACIGSLVVDNKIINPSIGRRAVFGMKKTNEFFIGYLSEQKQLDDFSQLIEGVGWIVKDGKVNVDVASSIEGFHKSFIDLLAPRVIIGYDKYNRLLIMAINGYEGLEQGVTLYELAELAIEKGFVQGLNLDGGGSLSFIENGKQLNTCSDRCVQGYNKQYQCSSPEGTSLEVCARFVTSIVCLRD